MWLIEPSWFICSSTSSLTRTCAVQVRILHYFYVLRKTLTAIINGEAAHSVNQGNFALVAEDCHVSFDWHSKAHVVVAFHDPYIRDSRERLHWWARALQGKKGTRHQFLCFCPILTSIWVASASYKLRIRNRLRGVGVESGRPRCAVAPQRLVRAYSCKYMLRSCFDLIACVRSTVGNGCILSGFFSFTLNSIRLLRHASIGGPLLVSNAGFRLAKRHQQKYTSLQFSLLTSNEFSMLHQEPRKKRLFFPSQLHADYR